MSNSDKEMLVEKGEGKEGELKRREVKTPSKFQKSSSRSRQEEQIALGQDMFDKVAYYVEGKLDSTAADYALLAEMNRAATEKYGHMAAHAEHMVEDMKLLQEQYEQLQPYLEKIDQVEKAVGNLEQSVQMLDAYTSRLDHRLHSLSTELRQNK